MDAKLELLLWTGISLLFGIVIVNAAYRAQGGRFISFMETSTTGLLVREVALFAFTVGIPFITLISGAAGLDLMALGADLASPDAIFGFTFVNWVRGIGVAAVIVTLILLVLWVSGRISPSGENWHIGLVAARNAFYDEAHWTFYRTAPALWLNDPYWGTVIGAALILLEWITHPEAPTWFQSVEGRQYLVVRTACLLSSAFLYLTTQNLWLMIATNLVIQIAGSRLLGNSQSATRHQLQGSREIVRDGR
ncbi:MAG: hypothetical protein M1546_18170 [Chloroflexi bacterium]|nr:hypothetical protein [Chloroflexota bacterium]